MHCALWVCSRNKAGACQTLQCRCPLRCTTGGACVCVCFQAKTALGAQQAKRCETCLCQREALVIPSGMYNDCTPFLWSRRCSYTPDAPLMWSFSSKLTHTALIIKHPNESLHQRNSVPASPTHPFPPPLSLFLSPICFLAGDQRPLELFTITKKVMAALCSPSVPVQQKSGLSQ